MRCSSALFIGTQPPPVELSAATAIIACRCDSITVAVAQGGRDGEVHLYGTISNDLHGIEKLPRDFVIRAEEIRAWGLLRSRPVLVWDSATAATTWCPVSRDRSLDDCEAFRAAIVPCQQPSHHPLTRRPAV